MNLRLGDTAPDFEAETTEGKLSFHDWTSGSWAVLFSHPRDFTPVCTTELGYLAKIKPNAMGFRYLGINARFPVLVTVGSSWSRACRRSACHAGWRPVPRAGELASWGGSAVFALVRRACSRG